MESLHVGEVARRAGLNPSAVRYYERRGLLPRPARTPSGYRLLGKETVDRLRFIQQAKALGLRLTEIREILRLRDHGDAPCSRVRQLAAGRLRAIDEKIAELRRFRRALSAMLKDERAGALDTGHICPLIESTGDSAPRSRRAGKHTGSRSHPARGGRDSRRRVPTR